MISNPPIAVEVVTKYQPFYSFKTGLMQEQWDKLSDSEHRALLYGDKCKTKPEREPNLSERVRGAVAPSEMQIVEMPREELARLPTFGGL